MPIIFIADNGSVRPAATLQLRQLAKNLSHKTGHTIYPVSFQHAHRIPAAKLNGQPAQMLYDFLADQLQQGQRDFILLPLFFGDSKALSSFVPEQVDALTQQFGVFRLQVAQVIYPLPQGECLLADIIYDHAIETALKQSIPLNNVVLVDHGSPLPRVTEVRKHLAQQVQQRLPEPVELEQAVMERREGSEYDFNGDLLQQWLVDKARSGETSAIVILQFFLPGKHAGEGGDIVDICDEVMAQYSPFKIAISPLISEHPGLLKILQIRLQQVMGETSRNI